MPIGFPVPFYVALVFLNLFKNVSAPELKNTSQEEKNKSIEILKF